MTNTDNHRPFGDLQFANNINPNLQKYGLLSNQDITGIALHEIVTNDKGQPTDYIFLDVNPAFETLTGLKRDKVLNRKATEVLPGIEKTGSIEIFGNVVFSGKAVSFEKYSEPLKRHYIISAYRFAEKRFATIFIDSTQMKAAEHALAERQKSFSDFIDSIDEIVVVAKLDGRIIFANNNARKKLGYSTEELLKMSVFDLHPEDCQIEVGTMINSILKGAHRTYPLPLKTKAGARIPAETRAWTGKWMEDNCILSICRDLRTETEARQRFERVFHANPALMALTQLPNRDFVDVNEAFLKKLGYEKEDVLGKTSMELGLFAREEQRIAISEMLRTDKHMREIEIEVRRKDGKILEGLFSGELIENQGKQFFLTVMLDITDIKEAERALRKSEAELSYFFSQTMDGIFSMQLDSPLEWNDSIDKNSALDFAMKNQRIVKANSAILKQYKASEKEFIGKTPSDLFVHDMGAGKRIFRDLFDRGRLSLETDERRMDGTQMWVKGDYICTYDSEGRITGHFGIQADITKQRKTRERMERVNRMFIGLGPDIFQNIEQIIDAARELLESEIVLYCRMQNGKLSRMWSSEDGQNFAVMDDPVRSFCYDRLMSPEIRTLDISDLDQEKLDFEKSILGKHSISDMKGYPITVHSKLLGFLFFCESKKIHHTKDEIELIGMISRTIGVEEERLSKEERLKDFIDIASHELKHPMSVIKGFSEILLIHEDQLTEEIYKESLEALRDGAERLNKIVEDLLNTSRIERGRFVLNKTEADIPTIAKATLSEMKKRFPHSDFEIRCSEDELRWSVDAMKIRELLVILLENALKHASSSEKTEIEISAKGNTLNLGVLDRGAGIPEESRESIFERFHQLGDVKHHSVPGMGLGLYIAREIVHLHGGEITCEARPGGGTVFRVKLAK